YTDVGAFSRPHGARRLPNGSVDQTFDPDTGPNWTVSDIALLPNGDILILGDFTEVNGAPRQRLARLHGYELRLDPPTLLADGAARLRAHGQTGARANIDLSDDLMHWSPFNTNPLTSTAIDLIDTN